MGQKCDLVESGSIYETLMNETLEDLEAVFNHPAQKAARRRQLSNSAEETDYEAWEQGFKDVLTANEAVVRRWAANG
ncbi:MAG: hypothetical protein FWB85_06865 [Chitinispirillia bacterium]|nr:hypothetical protein [Chitinispirillia bacterium]MCL2241956.1 hypothetical protein [Chitinispirillia bacterium]